MALKKEYMSVNGQVTAERDSSGWEVYTRDALGSVSAISDADGNLVSRIEYKAFGDVRTYTGDNPTSTPRRFLWNGTWGYRFNERYRYYTSHYVRARHYSSLTGNWNTADPLWPGERAYGYVENKVIWLSDPTGLKVVGGPPNPFSGGRCRHWPDCDDLCYADFNNEMEECAKKYWWNPYKVIRCHYKAYAERIDCSACCTLSNYLQSWEANNNAVCLCFQGDYDDLLDAVHDVIDDPSWTGPPTPSIGDCFNRNGGYIEK